jgi:hypothetical protein
MQPEDLQECWKAQGEEIFVTVAQWRAAYLQATLAEIEQAVDEQMNRLMSTAWKRLLALVFQLLASVIQGAIVYSQVSRNMAHRFAAALDEPYRFQFELQRVGFRLFCHLALL